MASVLALAGLSAAICFVGFMMLIASLGKTEQTASGAGWAILMPLSMIGGAMGSRGTRRVNRRIDNRAHAYAPVGLPPVHFRCALGCRADRVVGGEIALSQVLEGERSPLDRGAMAGSDEPRRRAEAPVRLRRARPTGRAHRPS